MTAFVLALALLTTQADAPVSTAPVVPTSTEAQRGEPLPPGAPSEPYELTAFCYGALGEWLAIYRQVVPDIQAIQRSTGGQSEAQPFSSDVESGRQAFERWGRTLQTAERASGEPIATRGAAAVARGRGIWTVAERGSRRSLARAWMYWGIPDRCDTVAGQLMQSSTTQLASLGHRAPEGPGESAVLPAAATLAPLSTPPPSTGTPQAGSILPPTFAPPPQTPEVGAPLDTPTRTNRDPAAGLSAAPPAPQQTRVIDDAPAPTAAPTTAPAPEVAATAPASRRTRPARATRPTPTPRVAATVEPAPPPATSAPTATADDAPLDPQL